MSIVAFYLLVFLVVGSFFLFFHMLIGKVIRPSKPEADKLTIYECGEPTVGSAWIQFDLRYYVVALLFVVFDVEVAFFFPWAVVFGTANEYSAVAEVNETKAARLLGELQGEIPDGEGGATNLVPPIGTNTVLTARGAKNWAWLAVSDVFLFFAVLMVGFAYLWRRGDIDWIRAIPESPPGKPAELPVRM